jgi:hypothetical protein
MKNSKLVLVAALAVVSSSQNLAAQTAQLFSDVNLRNTSATALDSARVQVASYHAPTANAAGGDVAIMVDAEDATVFAADRGSRNLFGSVDLRGSTSGAVAVTVTARNVLFGATDSSRVAVASVVSGQPNRFAEEGDEDAGTESSSTTSLTGSYEGDIALEDVEAVADGGAVIQLGGMDLLGSFGGQVQEVLDVRNAELIATNESSVRVGGVSIKGSFASTRVSQTTIINNLLAVADNRASIAVGGAHLGRR